MHGVSSKPSTALLAMALLLGAGCRRDEITHTTVPKGESGLAAAPGGAAPMARASAAGGADVPVPPRPTAGALQWTLPRGWSQSMSGGMRYATLTPSVTGRIEASVVVLPGPAGGELANVNRWRGQIGLEPMDEPGLAAARRTLETRAGRVAVFDFQSEGQKRSRVIAGIATSRGNTWFVKMTGDADPVAAARADFVHLLESLRFEDAQ